MAAAFWRAWSHPPPTCEGPDNPGDQGCPVVHPVPVPSKVGTCNCPYGAVGCAQFVCARYYRVMDIKGGLRSQIT